MEKRARVVTGTGEAQLAHLFALLDSFGMKRSHVQVQLHAGMAGFFANTFVVFLTHLGR